jgi:TonB family protein
MTTFINYFLEANMALLLFLAVYKLLLQKETDFTFQRTMLLAGIFVSLLFPLIQLGNNPGASPLSVGRMIPSYWLPEVVIGAESPTETRASFNFWKYASLLYFTGLFVCSLRILFQLVLIWKLIRTSKTYGVRGMCVAESVENKATFSFFHFIFIGGAHQLSSDEKRQIIKHESVHAEQGHSFDILLVNLLQTFFWFNPFIIAYKKVFIQLHEFEADARAVKNSDVNKYCSLLAKVALQSAGFSLANHFNHSLTLKRIEMMRTMKTNIKHWKVAVLIMMLPLIFFFISCQEQVLDEMTEITKNSSHALIIPDAVQKRFDELQKEHPDKKYVVLELNETASEKLQKLEEDYGLPKHVEVFNTGEAGTGLRPAIQELEMLSKSAESSYSEVAITNSDGKITGQSFVIIEFSEQLSKISDAASQEDKVYTVVQEQPEFRGGYDAMMAFIRQNLRYPAEARMQGIEGTVYISFIVGKDGTVSEAKIIRGISAEADREALRVVQLSPPWIPGKQNKEAVNVRFVLPIKFKLNVNENGESQK